ARAARARHAERDEAVGAHVLLRGSDGGEDERDLPADHVGDRLAAALVRHVLELRAGALLEELANEVRRAAGARRAIGKWLRLRLFDQLAQVPHARTGM